MKAKPKAKAKTKSSKGVKRLDASLMEKHPDWPRYLDRVDEFKENERIAQRRFAHFLKNPNATRMDIITIY